MPKATVRPDLDLSYVLEGPEGAPALVLITGLGGLKEGWFRQIPEFAKDHRVLAFDNRGAGGSSVVDRPTTVRDLAEDTALLMDAVGIARAHVWGVSLGGKVAQELALGWPERVDRLVLENTTAGEPARVDRGESGLRRAKDLDAEGWLTEVVPLLFARAYREANANSMRAFARSRERHPQDSVGMARQWEAYEAFDSWDRLPALTHRTLVLVGAEDALTDPENGRRIALRLPSAVFHAEPGAGHSAHIEKPAEVNAVVRRFLDAVPSDDLKGT